jgi:hypothetical protein
MSYGSAIKGPHIFYRNMGVPSKGPPIFYRNMGGLVVWALPIPFRVGLICTPPAYKTG